MNPQLPARKLVTKGIFKFMRHPIYFGWMLALFVAAIFYTSSGMFIVAVAMIPLIYLYALREEKILIRRFGKAYINYMKKVPG